MMHLACWLADMQTPAMHVWHSCARRGARYSMVAGQGHAGLSSLLAFMILICGLQELRKTIVPSAAAHKLDRLMQAVRYYQQQTKRKVMHHIAPRGNLHAALLTVLCQPMSARELSADQAECRSSSSMWCWPG